VPYSSVWSYGEADRIFSRDTGRRERSVFSFLFRYWIFLLRKEESEEQRSTTRVTMELISNAIPSQLIPVTKELFSFSPETKFGVGNPQRECENCKQIQVFMSCVGLTTAKRRMLLPQHTTLRQTREHFGSNISQEGIYDENHYRFADSDLDLPLWNFSNRCAVNILFEHDSKADLLKSTLSLLLSKSILPPVVVVTKKKKRKRKNKKRVKDAFFSSLSKSKTNEDSLSREFKLTA